MNQWRGTWISYHRLAQVLHHKRIIVVMADMVGDDRAVIEVLDGAEISLTTQTVMQEGHIGTPLLILCVSCELSIEQILFNVHKTGLGAVATGTMNDR